MVLVKNIRGRERVRARVRCFFIKGCCVYGSVAEGGGKGSVSGLWLEGRLCSMLTVMLGGDLDVATRVYTWNLRPRPTDVCSCQTVTVLFRLGLG